MLQYKYRIAAPGLSLAFQTGEAQFITTHKRRREH